jgi:hypothetical protein
MTSGSSRSTLPGRFGAPESFLDAFGAGSADALVDRECLRGGAVLASVADLQADGLAPSWLVRVGTCLALHFPGDNLGLCLGRPGLLIWELGRPGLLIWELGRPGLVIWELGRPGLVIWELGRRLFAALPVPAAKKTHSAAKKTHGVIIGR